MKFIGPFVIATSMLLIAGCGSLTVQVDVLDRTQAEQAVGEGRLRALYFEIARRGSDTLVSELGTLNQTRIRYMRALADVYDAKSKEPGLSSKDQENFVKAASNLRESASNPKGTIATRLGEAIQK